MVFWAVWPFLSILLLNGLVGGGVSGLAALLNSRSHVTFKMSVFYHHQKGRLIKTSILENNNVSRCRFCAHWCLVDVWFAHSSPLYGPNGKQSLYLYSPNCGPENSATSTCHFFLVLWLLLFCCSFWVGGIGGSQCLNKCAGTSLVVQWERVGFQCRGLGFDPWLGN